MGIKKRDRGITSGTIGEKTLNCKIAEIIGKRGELSAVAENTNMIVGNRGKAPDIVVGIDNNNNALIIETEIEPASSLDKDVNGRIGVELKNVGKPLAVIGIKIPNKQSKHTSKSVNVELKNEKHFKYYIRYDADTRFSKNGFLEGSLSDIITAISLLALPQDKIKKCINIMGKNIDIISYQISKADSQVQNKISNYLGQDPSKQTWNMAGLVLVNAAIFYEELAYHRQEIKAFGGIDVKCNIPSKDALIEAWTGVMDIDYVPIFESALGIIKVLPIKITERCIEIMSASISDISQLKVQKSGDVYGKLYQNMLVDRKKSASFYTRPQAASLLSELVLKANDDELWNDVEKVKKLRIADFACGTGMLLTHAYNHIKECLNGNVGYIHKHIMENCLYGYDIMPTATHLTVANLSGVEPGKDFDATNIYTTKIGKSEQGGYNLGSLDLIKDNEKLVVTGIQQGGRKSKQVSVTTIKHGTCDYILMNPPYVRSTNHGGGRKSPIPPFAVFGIKIEDQYKMADLQKKLFKNTCADGGAGLASYYLAICDKKIKSGGVIGLILPSSVYSGKAWHGVREMLREKFENIIVVFVNSDENKTYSSDTSMNEIMLIAQKRITSIPKNVKARVKTVILNYLPELRLESIQLAKLIKTATPPPN